MSPPVGASQIPEKIDPSKPRSEWWETLRNSTSEVFSTMVGIALVVPEQKEDFIVVPEANDSSLVAHVTGMIGIAGAMRAIFSLRCNENTATKIAAQMLGIPITEAAGQTADAIGEICNMIAGDFKHRIGFGDSCTLSVPTVVSGGRYKVYCLAARQHLEFPATYEGEPVLVSLEIRG